jgi:glycine betaine/choline ABC-type transport system substrate-binding protein
MSVCPITRRDALRLAAGGALAFAGCGSRANTIRVGSKNFSEQIILGELLAQRIEAHTALRVERRFDLGGTFLCHQGLLSGQLDLYPEYTGTALTAILKDPPSSDPAAVYKTVHDAYRDQFHLDVGPPYGFDNTFAIVVRGGDAQRLKLRTISDMVPHAPQWRAGFGYEFMERPDGYQGWTKTYGLMFRSAPKIMDLGLLYRALQENQVDVVAGNSTDGLIASLKLVVLEDDRHYFPPYQAVTIARSAMFDQHPELRSLLDALAGKISASDMQSLNYELDGQHHDVTLIAKHFRETHNL